MKTCYITILGVILFTNCANADFSGNWTCISDKQHSLNIKKIAKNTYEIRIDDTYTLNGEVNENKVLTVSVMGSKSLFTLNGNELRWSDGDCKEFTK